MSTELATVERRQLTTEAWQMLQSVGLASHKAHKFGLSSGHEGAIKLLFCWENGLPLSAANTGLYIVNGRVAAQSNVIAAQIRKHPNYDYRIGHLDNEACSITILRRNEETGKLEDYGETTFTMDDARKAGLAESNTYQKYPRNMLFGRAVTNAHRFFCPDVFNQPIYTPEELGAPVDGDGNVIEGQWTVVAEEPKAPSLNAALKQLTDHWTPAEIFEANEGAMPTTLEEVEACKAALEGLGGEPGPLVVDAES